MATMILTMLLSFAARANECGDYFAVLADKKLGTPTTSRDIVMLYKCLKPQELNPCNGIMKFYEGSITSSWANSVVGCLKYISENQ